MELRHLIFKFKRLNHFKQRMQSLSVSLENQKAIQHDGIVNMFINKNRGSNERVLRCLSSKCISITSQFVQVIYLCHLSKLAVVIESHELMNKSYLSVKNLEPPLSRKRSHSNSIETIFLPPSKKPKPNLNNPHA